MTPRNRADWLTLATVIAAFVVVFWALFGTIVARALGWQP